MVSITFIFSLLFCLLSSFQFAFALECYQCDSNTDLECSEYFDHKNSHLKPMPCNDIQEARFCTKTTGIYGGSIGTVRNCSSRDLGDYCTYIDRPGDVRYTRSCVYTCSRDGCNTGHMISLNIYSLLVSFATIATISNYVV